MAASRIYTGPNGGRYRRVRSSTTGRVYRQYLHNARRKRTTSRCPPGQRLKCVRRYRRRSKRKRSPRKIRQTISSITTLLPP